MGKDKRTPTWPWFMSSALSGGFSTYVYRSRHALDQMVSGCPTNSMDPKCRPDLQFTELAVVLAVVAALLLIAGLYAWNKQRREYAGALPTPPMAEGTSIKVAPRIWFALIAAILGLVIGITLLPFDFTGGFGELLGFCRRTGGLGNSADPSTPCGQTESVVAVNVILTGIFGALGLLIGTLYGKIKKDGE